MLTLSGPRFFRYRKDRGGGVFHPPFDSSKNWWVEYSICTYATIKFFWNFFSVLKVLGLKNASKFDLLQKCQNQNLQFWIFSKKSFRNELLSPFLHPYTSCEKFSVIRLKEIRHGLSCPPPLPNTIRKLLAISILTQFI